MKVLILTCSTGEGHNSAAKAIAASLEQTGHTAELLNALTFLSRAEAELISQGHVFAYRYFPKLYGVGYRMEERRTSKRVYTQCAKAAQPLFQHIRAHGYDTVLCVHPFASLMITEIRKRYSCPVKAYFVATDYTCSPSVEEGEMDAYFIPRGLTKEFVLCGLPEEKLVETGIPVSPAFYQKTEQRAARRQLGLPEEERLALLMGGSMGAGPMAELAEAIAAVLPEQANLAVICGSNEKLYAELQEKALPHTQVLGYTQQMSLWMDAADLLVSKPGGLSSTEAAAKHLPMLLVHAVPGCETRNLEFLVQQGYAATEDTVPALAAATCDFLCHPEKTEAMARRLSEDFQRCGAEEICRYLNAQ